MEINEQISSIGLGCVTFGREIDREASFAMMDHARANGITFFDTAAVYGSGMSESIVGAWLASRSPPNQSIIIGTKVLPPFDAKSLLTSVNGSLRRLGVETIDVLYLHRWDPTLESPGALAALEDLLRSGKVRRLGASNFSLENLQRAVRLQSERGLSRFSFVQNNHNLAVSDVNREFRQLCSDYELKIVTYSPLGAGFLTGKHQQGVESGSRFDIIPGHQDVYFNQFARNRLKKLQAVAARLGCSPAHLALAWALHQPGVASVLIGGRTPVHLDQAFEAQAFYDRDVFAELEFD